MLTLEKLFNGEKYPGLIGDIKTVAWQSKWILTAWAFYKSNFIYQYRNGTVMVKFVAPYQFFGAWLRKLTEPFEIPVA